MPDQEQSSRRARRVLAGAGVILAIVFVVVVWLVPGSAKPSGFAAANESVAQREAAAIVFLQIDSIDAATGRVSTRVAIGPGLAIPAGGVKVQVGTADVGVVKIKPGEPPVRENAVFDVDRGSVTDYPFDRYRLTVSVAALRSSSSQNPGDDGTETLPVQIVGNSSAFGFSVDDTTVGLASRSRFDLKVGMERTLVHRAWASGMMAIDWALAAAAVTVVLTIVIRARSWETRHLAWLGSMIFALAAFRNTAPGGPPLGVFMDTAAFFWSEALVVLSLMTLVVIFLIRPRNELE